MGIFCEINLFKPPDGVFYAGKVVSGIIKYAVDEPMDIKGITVSLQGRGQMVLQSQTSRETVTYVGRETYIDTDIIVLNQTTRIPVGCYEFKFAFTLPEDIPPSFNSKIVPRCGVNCKIKYYVLIRFDKNASLFSSSVKHYRKDITVASTVTPKLPMEPKIYNKTRRLLKVFSCKDRDVTIIANIMNSVILNGGKIEVATVVQNNTDCIIKSVQMKLIEVYTFTIQGWNGSKDLTKSRDVPNCNVKTPAIRIGATQNMPLSLNVPSDRVSLDHSQMVSRDYIVRITAQMPIPHRNVVLDIPVQIGNKVQHYEISENPPTYWETMGEAPKDDDE